MALEITLTSIFAQQKHQKCYTGFSHRSNIDKHIEFGFELFNYYH